MSGIVLMIPEVDYSQANIGQISILQDIPVQSISIDGVSIVEDATAQYSIVYTPSNTAQVGVDWSIESGSEYVSINSNGLLSLTAPISEAVNVTIKAMSIFNPSVYTTKTVRLSTGAAIPVSVDYVNGSRKASQTGINTSYTNMATFTNATLLNWRENSYKVTLDANYKAYFAVVRPSDYRCGARSSELYTNGEFDVTTILESISGSIDVSTYNQFALVVVDASYNPSAGVGPNVDVSLIASHVSVSMIA